MTTARALQQINSGFGAFARGDPITGVPWPTVETWAAAGIVSVESPPPDVTPAPPEVATIAAPETASTRPAAARRAAGQHPSGDRKRG